MHRFANAKANFFFHLRTVCSLLLLLAGSASACIRTPVGRDVSVVSARWYPNQDSLNVIDNLELLRTEEVKTLREEPTLHGKIEVIAYSSTGRGTGSRVILILQKPVEDQVYLPIPDDETVIYIQQGNGWKTIPDDVPMLDDVRLRLETRKEDKIYATEATLELPGGGGELLGGVGWTEE
ncbi:MAG TPA: hypothetical protein VK905_04965 [Bacillota bacterium]|nr:hypothetical protein [Bacillota bacterium]